MLMSQVSHTVTLMLLRETALWFSTHPPNICVMSNIA